MDWLLGLILDSDTIINLIIPLIIGFLGYRWGKAKAVLKETIEFLGTVSKALDDDKITKKELAEIMKEWKDVAGAIKARG
jgi:hypothetical protein